MLTCTAGTKRSAIMVSLSDAAVLPGKLPLTTGCCHGTVIQVNPSKRAQEAYPLAPHLRACGPLFIVTVDIQVGPF